MVDFSITLNTSQKGRPPLLSFIQSSSIDFCFKLAQGKKLFYVHCNPLQGSTGKYREIPVMKTGTLQWEQGSPVMKAGFSLWELTYREFPVSLTGFGFAVLLQRLDTI